MLTFLLLWLVCAVVLAVAAGGLWLTYRLSGTDFGLYGLRRETIVVMVASSLQAATVVGIRALVGGSSHWSGRSIGAIMILLLYFIYKLSHLDEMEEQEIGLLIVTDLGILTLLSLYSTL